MNEAYENIMTRRSCKDYSFKQVEKELIEKIVRAGEMAPTGQNKQSPIILAITNKEIRDEISKINAEILGEKEGFDPFYNAPVLFVVLADKSMFTYVNDGSLVLGNMLLAANSLGLDACWIHRAKEEMKTPYGRELLEKIGVDPDKYEGIGNMVLGYKNSPLKEPSARKENYTYFID